MDQNESSAELTEEEVGITKEPRRNFLKRMRNWLGVGVGTAFLGREIKIAMENKISTKEADFYPIYEHHDVGYSQNQIPIDSDVFVSELWEPIFDIRAERLVEIAEPRDNQTFMIDRGMVVGFTDVATNKEDRTFTSNGEIDWTNFSAALFSSAAVKVSSMVDKKHVNRRNFLRLAGGIGLATSISSATEPLAYTIGRINPNQEDALNRVVNRINGIASNFNIDDAMVFFRNVINADKMLEVAKWQREKIGRKPKIAYRFGAGHVGMEDFLTLGQDVCRTIIATMPKTWLEEVVELNGGVDNVCSSRIIDFTGGGQGIDFAIKDEELVKIIKAKVA